MSALILQALFFGGGGQCGASGKETGCTWRISQIKQNSQLIRFSLSFREFSVTTAAHSLSFSLRTFSFVYLLHHSRLHSTNGPGSPATWRPQHRHWAWKLGCVFVALAFSNSPGTQPIPLPLPRYVLF